MSIAATGSTHHSATPRVVMAICLSCVCGFAQAAPQAEPAATPYLPQRNLLIEVRQSEVSSAQTSDAGIKRGDVVVSSDGQVTGQASVSVQASTASQSTGTVQQLTVLNGSRASFRLAQAVPLRWWEVVAMPNGKGANGRSFEVLPTTIWTEAGQALSVRPSWRSGRGDVTVEVLAEQSQPSDPNVTVGKSGQVAGMPAANQTATVLTTVQVPLGSWITIASTVEDKTQNVTGTVSLRGTQRNRQRYVQIRVTAPGTEAAH